MNHQEFRDAARAIPYQYRHQEFLYALVRWLRPKTIVEVGTHIGATAVWLARACQENAADGFEGKVYCIDPFCWPVEHHQETSWHLNLIRCGVQGWAVLLKGRSQEVRWPDSVDFAYIDGNHSSEVCRWDTREAMLCGATCVAFNDHAQFAGVRQIADSVRESRFPGVNRALWDVFDVPFDGGLFVLLKRQPIPEPIDPDADPWDKP